jgi:hypothetical protein
MKRRDPELAAMETMMEALEPLQTHARERVLAWVRSRFPEPDWRVDPASELGMRPLKSCDVEQIP